MGKIFKIFDNILYRGMLIVALVCFLFGLNFQGFLIIIAFPFAWFFSRAIEKAGIHENYKIIMYLMLWVHLFGEFYFYTNVFYYDKILHFVVPIFITSMVYDYIKRFKLEFQTLQIFLIVMGMLCMFEIFEYFVDLFLHYGMQKVIILGEIRLSELHDTFWDLIFGALGVASFLIYRRKNA